MYVVLPEHPWWGSDRAGGRQQLRRELRLHQRQQRRVAERRRAHLAAGLSADVVIPYGHQTIDDDDIAAVVAVLRSDWLTQGPAVERVRDALVRARPAPRHAVAFVERHRRAARGALAAAGIGPGDRVATSPLSFVASANCARGTSARDAGFVDIDPETLNLDPARSAGATRSVAVHYAGLPVDLAALDARARAWSIEDAAHALGATTPDGPVGNCARSDLCMLLVPPGEDDHDRRRRRGHDELARAGSCGAALPSSRHRSSPRRGASGATTSSTSGTTTASPTSAGRSA